MDESPLKGSWKQRSRRETESPTESMREEDEALTKLTRRRLQGRAAVERGIGKQGLGAAAL